MTGRLHWETKTTMKQLKKDFLENKISSSEFEKGLAQAIFEDKDRWDEYRAERDEGNKLIALSGGDRKQK